MNNKEFAVIKVNSKQFIVSEGDTLVLDRISPQSSVEVLLLNVDSNVEIGEPIVENAGVVLEVIEEKKDKKISVRRFKSKSRYRKNRGHRQPISIVKIKKLGKGVKNDIVINLRAKNAEESKAENKAEKKQSTISSKDQKANSSKKQVDEKVSDSKPTKDNLLLKDVEGISDAMKEKLQVAGFDTVEKVKNASDQELTSIKGVGQKAVDKLREIIK